MKKLSERNQHMFEYKRDEIMTSTQKERLLETMSLETKYSIAKNITRTDICLVLESF